MINKTCNCGRSFTTYPSREKLGRGKFCSRECSDKVVLFKKGQHVSPATEIKKGTKPWNAKGFRYTLARKGGNYYKEIFIPIHPLANKSGYVRGHRLVMEKELGRYLLKSEIVHHIDGDTLNNNIENLQVMDKRDHDRMNTPLNIHKQWQRGGGL